MNDKFKEIKELIERVIAATIYKRWEIITLESKGRMRGFMESVIRINNVKREGIWILIVLHYMTGIGIHVWEK